MNKDDIRKNAEAHADYSIKLIELANPLFDGHDLELMRYIYVQAFCHSAKHALAGDFGDATDQAIADDLREMLAKDE